MSRLAAFAVLALYAIPALPQVQLKSGTLQPSAKTTAEFVTAVRASAAGFQHGVAVFTRHPSPDERKTLEAAGLRVLAPLLGLAYRVRVEKHFDPATLKIPDLQVALIELAARDRVDPAIWRGDFAQYQVTPPGAKPVNYVLNTDGTLTVSVRMHSGVAEADSRSVLDKHAASYRKQSDLTWVAIIPRAAVQTLAAQDIVQWIDAGPLPFLPENDSTRALLNVDVVQNFNAATGQVLGLGGSGVQVAIFDKGLDQTHGDLVSRVIRNDADLHTHATHLAGTVAGTGAFFGGTDTWGMANGGTPYQWRGMAPLAQLIDADQANGEDTATYLNYITNLGMDLSSHSYKLAMDGVYDQLNHDRDELVRGDAVSGGVPVPARLQVSSSGNEGRTPHFGGHQVGYFSLSKQVKNALVVGNWNLATNRIADSSSLGPAHDGRIKPDVVAPGSDVKSTGYCKPNDTEYPDFCKNSAGLFLERRQFYRKGTGSSMATAVTSGVLALVLEQYAATYGVQLDQRPPLPSTLRGVMIHTAIDKSTTSPWAPNPDGEVKPGVGPDFVTGWGLINAQAAVSAVAQRRLAESAVPATCHVRTFLFHVPTGTSPLRVTLAWDDFAADANTTITPKLVNDLDLILVAPSGSQHYPWKLDQEIRDSTNNVIPDAAQQCGTSITVGRQFLPIADPSTGNDSIPGGVVPSAVRGRDHLNNVEVVDTPAAAQPGIWVAKIIGFNVPEGPQRYSLIGGSFYPLVAHPTVLCREFPMLCQRLSLGVSLCERYPQICDPRFSFPGNDRIRIRFSDRRQKLVLPLDATCHRALNCPPCASNSSCSAYSMYIGLPGTAIKGSIFTGRGDPVSLTVTGSGGSRRAGFTATPGERYFAVVEPAPGADLGNDYDIKLRLY